MPTKENCQGFAPKGSAALCLTGDKSPPLTIFRGGDTHAKGGKHKRIQNYLILTKNEIMPYVDFSRFRTIEIIVII